MKMEAVPASAYEKRNTKLALQRSSILKNLAATSRVPKAGIQLVAKNGQGPGVRLKKNEGALSDLS
jgi:hypothetical protein